MSDVDSNQSNIISSQNNTINQFNNNMGVLSNLQIKAEYTKNNIVFHPYNEKLIGNCSVDVTLGEYYYTPNPSQVNYLNPWSQQSISQFWGDFKKAEVCSTLEKSVELAIPLNSQYIILQPHEVILAHTEQFIGGKMGITTMMKGRSTMGRCGISICKCAGWGDQNYYNKWTCEIENHNNVPVILIVGQKIGQIVFIYCGVTNTPYHEIGSYQNSDNLEKLIADWNPTLMLPKAKLF